MDVGNAILHLYLVLIHIQSTLQTSLTTRACSSDAMCLSADPNAVCNNLPGTVNGYCKCKNDYRENGSWVCVTKVLNRACTEDLDCTKDQAFVECNVNKVCACKPGYGSYKDNDSCEKVLGRPCVASGGCTMFLPNTTCFAHFGFFTCSCLNTHVQQDNICKIKLDGTCSSNKECVDFGVCNRKTDTCRCSKGYIAAGDYCVAGSKRLNNSLHTCAWSLTILIILRYTLWM